MCFSLTVGDWIDERLGYLFGIAPAVDTFAHIEGRQVVPQWRDERRVTTLIQYFKQAPEPWFVHLHLLDTHCCQWVPDKMHFSGGKSSVIDARDSQVRETDGNIRRLFEALQSTGQLDRTIVVILSDHALEWEITERLPLMIRFPNRHPRGRIAANVQLADVAPTMLSYLGAAVPSWMDGQSLIPVSPSDRASDFRRVRNATPCRSVRFPAPARPGAAELRDLFGHDGRWCSVVRTGSQRRRAEIRVRAGPHRWRHICRNRDRRAASFVGANPIGGIRNRARGRGVGRLVGGRYCQVPVGVLDLRGRDLSQS